MDIVEAVKRLAQLAREEAVPDTDVSEGVLMRIQAQPEPVLAPFWVLAVGSAAAAAVVLAITAWAWASWSDPMVALFTQFRMVML